MLPPIKELFYAQGFSSLIGLSIRVISSHARLNVKVFFDSNWKQKFGNDSENAAKRVIVHAQHVLKWSNSLTTKIWLNLDQKMVYIPEPLAANDKL